MSKKKFKKVL